MNKQVGSIAGGCLTFVAGMVAGASILVLALVGWALVRPADLSPLQNRLSPGGADLEVRVSEAFLNQAVADALAERDLDNRLARIVVDVRPRQKLEATLEGQFSLDSAAPTTPLVSSEIAFGLDAGLPSVRIERVGVGPVYVVRDALPDWIQPYLQTAEEAMIEAMVSRIQGQELEVTEVRTDEEAVILGLRMNQP
jgi:hypothetical protein